jgi:hypothetical protein
MIEILRGEELKASHVRLSKGSGFIRGIGWLIRCCNFPWFRRGPLSGVERFEARKIPCPALLIAEGESAEH